jgi:hypothetical protein
MGRIEFVVAGFLAAPMIALAFLPNALISSPRKLAIRTPGPVVSNFVGESSSRWSQDSCSSMTQLNMAFKSDRPSNMFDGPTPLVKERDACGVGFIANTKSGGTILE